MVSKKAFKNRLLAWLCVLVAFVCFPLSVQAAEFESYTVSGGDLIPQTDSGIVLMSVDDGISTVASVYPYEIPSGLKTITYWPSYTTSHEVLEISLFKFSLSDYISDNSWRDCNAMKMYGNINIQNIVGMNPYLARLWVRNGGKKYELVNYNNSYFLKSDDYLDWEFEVGIDIYFNNKFNADSDRPFSEYSRPDLNENNLTVVWEAFSFDCYYYNTLEGVKLDNIDARLQLNNWHVTEKLNEVISNIQTYGQMIVSNIQVYCGDIINTLSEKFNELIGNINVLLYGSGSGSSTSISEGGSTGSSGTLQEQANNLQEEANTLQEEANETQKNIFDKIADFFDNFFSRLGEFLLGLIVPSAEELTAFLDEVNVWFGERLGFIWYPFSFAVDMVAALANGTADTGFQVPEFKLNILGTEYQIWGGMTVDMDAFGIFQYVRIFTSFLLVAGIVKLALDKWDEWIGGHGVG